MKPRIGRIVHYMDGNKLIRAAIITDVAKNDGVTLTVFEPNGTVEYNYTSSMAAGPRKAEPGQWWWPERV